MRRCALEKLLVPYQKGHINLVKRYILFPEKRHREEMGRDEIEMFFTHLGVEGNEVASRITLLLIGLALSFTEGR